MSFKVNFGGQYNNTAMVLIMHTMQLPDSFYQEEERCGYLVSEKMKKVWAVELELLKKFSEVCDAHGLRYYLDGGTLLGAVRHKGFIPWDDDVDVIMPREDYDKLFEIAQQVFEPPYFFQTVFSEKRFFRTHAQLRHSETTGFIDIDKSKDINKGIFLDIFVLDGVADNAFLRFLHKWEIMLNRKLLTYQYDRKFQEINWIRKMLYFCVHRFFDSYPYKAFFDRFNKKVLARYSHRQTKLIGDLTLQWRKNVQWPREWWADDCLLPFENLVLRAPVCYHQILQQQYGDYMKLPERVSDPNGRVHGHVTFDPDTPYTDYFKNERYD